MMVGHRGVLIACAIAFVTSSCMVAKRPAPVVQRAPEAATRTPARPAAQPVRGPQDQRPDTYVVKRGDTLYGIALDHGLDYRDLARWNGIANPSAIEVGQVLRVKEPQPATVTPPPASVAGEAVVTPYQSAPAVRGREVGPESAPVAPSATAPSGAPPAIAPTVPPALAGKGEPALEPGVITAPMAIKLPYSEAALAKLEASPAEPPSAAVGSPAPPSPRTEPPAGIDEAEALAWGWPTKGKIVANFNENGGPKGLQIAGDMGQAIVASAAGRVVYTGSGLRGYGNLVIIKHNNTYLSAYAHNRSVLVKQGDNVVKGQKIAEMGNSDANRVMLHFEIRRQGKPVDPMKFLPPT